MNIDINGDSIWFTHQYNKNKELTGVTMHVQGKVLNVSDNNVDMDYATSIISKHLEQYYGGEFDGISFNTEVDIFIANSMDDVSDSDHIFALADINLDGLLGKAQDFGHKVAFIDADLFSGVWDKNFGNVGERTAGHEFGHLANLRHEDGGYFDLISEPTSRWSSLATNVTGKQLKKIYSSWKNGYLNKGNNYEYIPIYSPSQGRTVMKKMPNRGIRPETINY